MAEVAEAGSPNQNPKKHQCRATATAPVSVLPVLLQNHSLQELGLSTLLQRPVGTLSGGEERRVALAAALVDLPQTDARAWLGALDGFGDAPPNMEWSYSGFRDGTNPRMSLIYSYNMVFQNHSRRRLLVKGVWVLGPV